MEIVVLVTLLVGGVLYYVIKTNRRVGVWNDDPRQKQLALMFARATDGRTSADVTMQVVKFLAAQGWKRREISDRIPHALTITKLVAPPGVYQNAVEIGKSIVVTWEDDP